MRGQQLHRAAGACGPVRGPHRFGKVAGMAEELAGADNRPDPKDEEAYMLDEGLIDQILQAVEVSNTTGLTALLEPLHAADIADLLEQISAADRRALIALWGREIDGEILSEIDESIREEVIDAMPRTALADAVRELETDDVVDILEDLEEPEQEFILDALEVADRVAVQAAMAYPEGSAGRLMQRETVVAPEHWTVGEAIDHLRSADWLPEQFYHVILVDPRMHPVAYVTLGRILSSGHEVKLATITEDSFRTIPALQDEADVAYAFNQYHLISAPVVDAHDRLVGVITIDDAVAVLDDEHEEDILLLGGVGTSNLSDGVFQTVRRRFPWLFVNLIAANLAALVIVQFSGTITALVALAAVMPIVASMGGNAGTQSLTVAVRALATKDLTSANAARVVRREALVGIVNGLGLALTMALVGLVVYGSGALGLVIGAAMMVNLLVAALAGVLVPLTLSRLNLDPALASGTFVTTMTDVTGFFVFLGLATLVLV